MRKDLFQVGDKITWASENHATMNEGRQRFGDGPFIITQIQEPHNPENTGVGHRQWLWSASFGPISGFYFRLADE